MATVPLSATVIHLLKGVPFNHDYKNSRWFTSKVAQTSYFSAKPKVHTMTEYNFQRIEGKHFIAVNKDIDSLWGTNYIMFQNSAYGSKWFYAFVTKIEYKQRNNTHVHFEIDVLQTWKFDMQFKPSFVVREHRPLWNSDGTPVLNTIDEGLAYGSEYDNRLTTRLRTQLNNGYRFLVIVSKTPLERKDGEKINEAEAKLIGSPQPLSYYIVPFKNDLTPTVIVNGGDNPITPPTRLLSEIYKQDEAINNIVSLYVTDYTGINSTTVSNVMTFPTIQGGDGNAKLKVVYIGDEGLGINVIKVEEVVKFHAMEIELTNDKYDHYVTPTESKLLMSPYTSLTFDDMRGNRVDYKLEHIKGKKLTVIVKGSLGTTNQVSYSIKEYNNDDVTHEIERSDENALFSNNPSDVPILNDMLSAFLQGNKNSIQNQKNQAMWSGVTSIAGNSIGAVGSVGGQRPSGLGVASSVTGAVKGVGDTVLQLQAIESKQQDIGNNPPSMAKMGSNVAYDFGNNYQGIYILRKQIKPEYRRILSDFFNMFGYKTNQVKAPNFMTRQNWNYVQTLNCTILGDFNNEDLTELKAVFDGGITLWHTEDVGNYNLSNGVR